MSRRIELTLERRAVSCVAELLETAAPRTCDEIWAMLPFDGPLWHTKTAGNEVYTLLPGFEQPPPVENGSLIPLPGDLLCFSLPRGIFPPSDPRWIDANGRATLTCIASFYDRNSIHWMELGFVAGSRWAHIVEGFEAWQVACHDVWANGCAGERLTVRRFGA